MTLSEKSSNQRSNVYSHKGLGKRRAGETIGLQFVEPLNNINDAVKTIVGQRCVAPSQNDEIDTDMHFCKSLVSSLQALCQKRIDWHEWKFERSYLKLSLEKILVKHLHWFSLPHGRPI